MPAASPRTVRCILVGHPDLRRTMRLTVNEAFYQRLAMRYHLGPLDLQETVGYVRHHVKIAGYTTGQLFTDDTCTCTASAGVP